MFSIVLKSQLYLLVTALIVNNHVELLINR